MNRLPLPQWLLQTKYGKQYTCIGGVEEYDIWARTFGRHSKEEWDVFVLDTTENMIRGMDVYVSTHMRTHYAQKNSIATRRVDMGDEKFKRMVIMLQCFAPHLFKGRVWPELKKGKIDE